MNWLQHEGSECRWKGQEETGSESELSGQGENGVGVGATLELPLLSSSLPTFSLPYP